jgi:hypothetical protein
MAGHGGSDIVTDGLVLCLDAADKNSHPGSGTTWYDLSNGMGDSSYLNSPTFQDNGSLSSVYFDGSDDNVSIPGTLNATAGTISIWLKATSWGSNDLVFKAMGGGTNRWYFRQAGSTWNYTVDRGNPQVSKTVGSISSGIWGNITMTYYTSNILGYLNGTLTTSDTFTDPGTAGGTIRLGGYSTSSTQWSGYIAIVLIYNRTLSAKEVSQNFNAQRGRFGV